MCTVLCVGFPLICATTKLLVEKFGRLSHIAEITTNAEATNNIHPFTVSFYFRSYFLPFIV